MQMILTSHGHAEIVIDSISGRIVWSVIYAMNVESHPASFAKEIVDIKQMLIAIWRDTRPVVNCQLLKI